jgi:hypothetical protein
VPCKNHDPGSEAGRNWKKPFLVNALTGNQNDWLGVPHIKDPSVNQSQLLKAPF